MVLPSSRREDVVAGESWWEAEVRRRFLPSLVWPLDPRLRRRRFPLRFHGSFSSAAASPACFACLRFVAAAAGFFLTLEAGKRGGRTPPLLATRPPDPLAPLLTGVEQKTSDSSSSSSAATAAAAAAEAVAAARLPTRGVEPEAREERERERTRRATGLAIPSSRSIGTAAEVARPDLPGSRRTRFARRE